MKKKSKILPRVFTDKENVLIHRRKHADYSKAETIIGNFLAANNIQFYTEFFFKELVVGRKQKLLFFDFYIPDYRLCIEFDGIQHYTKTFNGKPLKNSELNDFIKNAFCKKNDLHLLRIKYTDFKNIEDIICKKFDQLENKKPA